MGAASATGRYCRIGNVVTVNMVITITTNGTGAGSIRATLPIQALSNNYVLYGREITTTGNCLVGTLISNGTIFEFQNYNNTYPAANGYVMVMGGSYEVT